MEKISSGAEQLLLDIITHRSANGACDLDYWEKRFEKLESDFNLEVQVRSQFGTLERKEMINVQWGDDVPTELYILDRGFEYYEKFIQKGQQQMFDVKVFVSYNQKTGSEFADAIEKKLEGKATVIRDKSGITPWGSITKFMNSIREQDFAVAVITDAYLKSQPCMFEIATMMREHDWQKRIIPAVLETDIYGRKLEYAEYWSKLKVELEEKAKNVSGLASVQALAHDADQISKICSEISSFLTFVLDRNNPPIYTVLDEIEKRVLTSAGNQ